VYGAGVQNKVLEALACGTPVVATPPAVAALHPSADQAVGIAPDAASFASSIVDLLENKELARQRGVAGREFVERHHNWNDVAELLEQTYCEAIEERLPRGVPVMA
jgi:glycosyltransferase involved in cell wall biosynthesis